ncbi:MAG TPA: hypothetical protein VFD43_12650 [Planctomycetota bacterium]|nr:hypothetical protein [Planctomycetota bacterium]
MSSLLRRPDLSALLLLALLAPSAAPQADDRAAPTPQPPAAEDAAPAPDTRPPVIGAGELELRYHTSLRTRARDLLNAVEGLATRMFYVRSADGTITGPVSNVRAFGISDTLVIYDRPERIEQITRFLSDLEAAVVEAEAGSAATLQVAEYSPRHVSLDTLREALRPFLRKLDLPGADDVRNVSSIEVPARIVIRDTQENVEQMRSLLERIDVPAPQLMLHCWLLHGADRDGSSELPPELVENLLRLVPLRGFAQDSMAILRTSVVAGREQVLRGEFLRGGSEERFELELVPAGYDPRTRLLTLERCSFESTTGQQFSTAAVLEAGEFVVLGAAGGDPLFVVLRVTPVED